MSCGCRGSSAQSLHRSGLPLGAGLAAPSSLGKSDPGRRSHASGSRLRALGWVFQNPRNQGMVSKGVCRLWASRSSQLWQPPGPEQCPLKHRAPGMGRICPRSISVLPELHPHSQILTPLSLPGTVALQALSVSGINFTNNPAPLEVRAALPALQENS